VAFDNDPERVRAAQKSGFRVLFGDGTRTSVLQAAGIRNPRAVVVCYTDKEEATQAVVSARVQFGDVPIYACACDLR
jgi:Trk K+ transport system NAD-binding subunit